MYALRTIEMLFAGVEVDGGVQYRQNLRKHMADSQDIFRGEETVRTQLGASGIGRPCEREQWLQFRWAGEMVWSPQMLLLFNRGHMEEPRLLSLLTTAGFTVHDTDEQGKQHGFSVWGGHYKSRGDGVVEGIPEVPDKPCLLEFKTHNEKNFNSVQADGVADAKPEHYAQVQTYMHNMGLEHTLYIAVCKNTDRLYGEIITYDAMRAQQLQDKAARIIFDNRAPPRLSKTASWWQCRSCFLVDQCYRKQPPTVTCRTCVHAQAYIEGQWGCNHHKAYLTTEQQLAACSDYTINPTIET